MPDEPKRATESPRGSPPDAGGADTTQLSPWRAAIARGRTRLRADALISLPDAEKRVPTLPVAQIYDAIMQVGLGDAGALLELCSPEQVRGLLDLDVWERDQIRLERLEPWIEALVDLGFEKVGQSLRGLDVELVARYLRAHTTVYDLSLEEAPEHLDRPLYPTPDRFFLIDIADEGEERKRIERLLDDLYRHDITNARRLLQTSRAEIDSQLEEMAYRWRAGRMADLGFVDYYEALDVYRLLDPAKVRPGEGTADPALPEGASVALAGPVADAMAGESFFARVMATITDAAELARVSAALLTLCNRILSADRVEPSDGDQARRSLERAHGFLSVGLEVIGRGDPAAAAEALRSIALGRVFRAGVSVALKAQQLADTLVRDMPVTLVPGVASLFEAPHAQVVAALRHRPPMTTSLLDDEGARSTAGGRAAPAPVPGADLRPIRSVVDIRRLSLYLEEAAAMARVVHEGLGLDLAQLGAVTLAGAAPARPDEIHLGDLVRTAAVRFLGGGALDPAPLEVAAIEAFRAARVTDGRVPPAAAAEFAVALAARLTAAPAPPVLGAWVARWLAPLDEDLARLQPPIDPRLVAGVLVAPAPQPPARRRAGAGTSAARKKRR
ncbi:MAG TPA: DUF6178 family protein [Polyangia bacterium]